ncbi:MAG: hypothetical protein NTY19_08345 [Planctomycetota bacterium]|nr:hypothetical protein [Planctomycetota bacterium]
MTQFKRNPKADDVYTFRHYKWPKSGPRPSAPATLEGRLDQLLHESEAWLRKFSQVWFRANDPVIEIAKGTADNPEELAERYDEAIATMQWIAACAKAAQPILKAGKEKVLARKAKPKAKKKAK